MLPLAIALTTRDREVKIMETTTYYDVYNWQGRWVGCYDYEWMAEDEAYKNCGSYIERVEELGEVKL